MLRTKTRLILPVLVLLAGAVHGTAQTRESCLPGYRVEWHYPDVLAELTQLNGPRSRPELDAVARELVRSATEPDADAIVETIRTHFATGIRSDYERATACMARNGQDLRDFDLDAAVARAVEGQRDNAARRAELMANLTLELAAHWSRFPDDPRIAGVPYAGAFEAAVELFDATEGGSGARVMREVDRERAAAVFERTALRPGTAACNALRILANWDEENLRANGWQAGPHPSFARIRRESPERCPGLDDPGG